MKGTQVIADVGIYGENGQTTFGSGSFYRPFSEGDFSVWRSDHWCSATIRTEVMVWILVSSANLQSTSRILSSKSLIQMRNSNGPSSDRQGTHN